tara:strand:- start:66 stop:572 length:507 start_codon:yes stop_codon:yes gene_type:complete
MLNKIDKLSQSEFTEVFGNIFENASWISEKLYTQKPFKNFGDLSKKMISIFEDTNDQNKLKILKSHPDLADKTKIGLLTEDSKKEQNHAKLDQCTEGEYIEFKNLNSQYKNKFAFPFIIAVAGKKKPEILNIFKKRILNSKKIEFDESIKQVIKIASLRLNMLKIKFL